MADNYLNNARLFQPVDALSDAGEYTLPEKY